MSSSSGYSRLCRLIDDSLPLNIESELISVNKQKEKDLLLALSQVSRKVRLWIYELDSDSYDDMGAQPTCTEKSENYEEHCCLTRIIANLIVFLTVESQYVQYLASNVLVVISEFVAISGSNWEGFVQFLCVCLEVSIGNILSSSLGPQTAGNEISMEKSSFVVFVKPRLKNANWSAVAGIIRVLRNILKYLKQEYDDQLGKIYLDSISSCLSNVPWDSLNDVCVGQNGDTRRCSYGDDFSLRNVLLPESRVGFLGNLVQFFCSLVEQSGSLDKHPVLCNISDLVPKLLYWCLGKQGNCNNFCISQYFKHKLLDDILFEVLLLMFSLPSCAEQQVCKERGAFQEMKEDVLLHVSHLFNPLHLFHLFLAELHYDHQVLLDYLISKDTGISCAEYILRCLRKICESWDLFVEFSVTGKFVSQSFRKKRKVFQNGPHSQVELSSSPIIDAGIPISLENECMRKPNYGNKECGSRGQPFKEAKECLLSLKNSVENLHQKSLFPYNPQVLLRRLMRFRQLCLEHEKC